MSRHSRECNACLDLGEDYETLKALVAAMLVAGEATVIRLRLHKNYSMGMFDIAERDGQVADELDATIRQVKDALAK